MGTRYAELLYTPSVLEQQTKYDSPSGMARMAHNAPEADTLGPREQAFIEVRDSFFMATVTETGWPYVQHRGGPPGFVRVLDEHTIGWADFRGNRQLISVGNLSAAGRASLIFMDYARPMRLKVLGTARVANAEEEPDLIEGLRPPESLAVVERAIVMRVEGFDWNCPLHITPRYTEEEIEAAGLSVPDRNPGRQKRILAQEDELRVRVLG